MIPRSSTHCQTDNYILSSDAKEPAESLSNHHTLWKQELADSKLSIASLLDKLQINKTDQQLFLESHQVPSNFPLRVTASYISRMAIGDPEDPLLRQIAPAIQELETKPGYNLDPLSESEFNPVPGIIQKYNGRALLIVAKACAVHCRYCFRRHFPYEDNLPGNNWQQALDYLQNDTHLKEVIYSGGDPLAANDTFLAKLTKQISKFKHISRLRIHTRLPIVLPNRINNELLTWVGAWPGEKIMVIHCNHPNEINNEVTQALKRLSQTGVTLLNQSVLLNGINNDPKVLIELSEKLFSVGVMPYYLHMLDPVSGAHHFDIKREQAKRIIKDVSANLPGYLVPKLVEEIPSTKAKHLL